MIEIIISINIRLNMNDSHVKHCPTIYKKIRFYARETFNIFIGAFDIGPIVVLWTENLILINCILISVSGVFPFTTKINDIAKRCILRLKA